MTIVKFSSRIGLKLMVFIMLPCLLLLTTSCKSNAKPEKPIEIDSDEQDVTNYYKDAFKDAEIIVLLLTGEHYVGFATKDPDRFMNLSVSINNKHFRGSELEIETEEFGDEILFAGSIDYRVMPGEIYLVSVKDKNKTLITKLIKVSEAPKNIDIVKRTTDSKYELRWTSGNEPTSYDISMRKGFNYNRSLDQTVTGKNSYTFTLEEQRAFLDRRFEPIEEDINRFLEDSILEVSVTATDMYRYGKVLIMSADSADKTWRYLD